jgi:hypothetical protein
MPEDFLHTRRSGRAGAPRRSPAHRRDHARTQSIWQWFALAALLFCWVAEATMCAVRGF